MKLAIDSDIKLPGNFWKIILLIVGISLGWNRSAILLIMGI
jgi:hypothetical protein